MKNSLLFVILSVFIVASMVGQQQVSNGDFEEWETHTLGFEYPVGWDNPNAVLSLFDLTPVTPSDDAASGLKSAHLESKLLSTADGEFVIPGVVTLGTFVVDYIHFTATLEGGVPFSDRPLALKGAFKNYPAAGDSTMVVAIFTKYYNGKRDTIGFGGLFSSETFDTWTNFSIPIYFFVADDPDTMNINIVSSNMIMPNKDSQMYIDNLSFEYEAGIGDLAEMLETSVFPNPANDKLSFSFEKELNGDIKVFSNDGQLVYSTTINGATHQMDVSGLASGNYYFAVFEKNKKMSSGQFVISR